MSTARPCPSCGLQVAESDLCCPRDGTPRVLFLDRSELPDPLVGLQVGEYRIEQRIGSGGMGVVYRAVQPMIGKQVAVKILRPEIAADPEQMQRLLAEARAVTAIHHRGIIDVFGFGQLPDGRQCITMELLEGVTLEQLAESGRRLPYADVASVLDELLSALAAAHAAGVIHRDLKPSNVFLAAQSDGTSVVKVLDFGLAKRAAPGASSPQTRISLMVGTPEFMAPEQARGEPVGPPTDLYALGVMAFQLFTGRLPFEGSTPIEIVLQHLDKAPPPLRQFAPELPERLQALILSLLSKAPSARPQRAEDVRHTLRQLDLPGVVLPPMALSGATALRPLVIAAAAAPETPNAVTSDLAKTYLRRRPFNVRTVSIGVALLLVAGTAAVLVHARGAPSPWAGTPAAPQASPARLISPSPVPPAAGRIEPPVQAPRAAAATSAAKAAPRTRPALTTPTPVPHRASRPALAPPSLAALQGRIDRLEVRINASAPAGAEPDPLALALLEKARRDLASAERPIQRVRLAHRLDVLEKKFLSP